jgi:peptide/nickel transport system substrate-binding protein
VNELPQGTVTFLFTDIEGSTELLKGLGDRYQGVLDDQARILREAASSHGGREVDNQGDSFFFAFARANAALGAAVVAQRALSAHEWPDGARVRVRMGLHTGEPSVGGERYVGLGVHRAARVGAAGHGGQVLLTNPTRELVEDEVDGVAVRELGVYRLKDIDRPELLYQLDIAGLPSAFPPLKAEKVEPPRPLMRRPLFVGALAGAIAAAVLVPLLALGGGSTRLSAQVTAPVQGDALGVFDTGKTKLTTEVAVEKRPSAVAVGPGAIWVANVDDDSVSEIDSRTNEPKQAAIAVGNGPSGLAIGGGFVWVANYLGRSISQIDPRTSEVVHTIRLGGRPSGVAFGDGVLWVADASDRSVLRIDPATDKPGKSIPVDAGAAAIAFGFKSLWVAGQNTGSVTRVDPSSGNTQPINVGAGPTAIAVGAGAVWVANSVDGTVSRIDPARNAEAAKIPVGSEPGAVAVAPDGSAVWVANTGSGTVSRIDPLQQNQVVQTVTTGNHPDGIGLIGSALYLAVRSAGTRHRGGTLTVVYDGLFQHDEAQLLDPALSYITFGWQALVLTNDGLVTFQRAGGSAGTRLVPDLATSLPTATDHGKTYTFQLRPGIRYADGRLVRPRDFRRAIERALAYEPPEGGGPGSNYFGAIVGAAACIQAPNKPCDLSQGIVTGANTVSFHLVKRDPDFLFKLAEPTAYAEPANTPLKAKVPLPATGPYEVASYSVSKSSDVLRLVRNPRFHEWSAAAQPAGYPERILLELRNVSVAQDVRAVLAGRTDLTNVDTPIPSSLDLSLHTRYAAQLHAEPTLATLWFALNTRVPPFDSLDVRRAIALAVDRKRLVQLNGGRDLVAPTCQILPPGVDGYRRYCPSSRTDLAQAKRLVAASGTKGATIVLNFGVPYAEHSPFPPYLRSLLRTLGYHARIHVVTVKQFGREQTDPRYKWQVWSTGWYADWPTASTFFSPFTCASFQPNATNENLSEFCDHRLDAQIARAQSLQLTKPQAAARIWARVDRGIVDQWPVVPVLTPQTVNLASARVGNYVYSPWIAGPFLDQLWVR